MPSFTVQFMGLCTFVQQPAGGWRAVLVDASNPAGFIGMPRLLPLMPHYAELVIAVSNVQSITPDPAFTSDGINWRTTLTQAGLSLGNPATPLTGNLSNLPDLSDLIKASPSLAASEVATNRDKAACHFDILQGSLSVTTQCTWDVVLEVGTLADPILNLARPGGTITRITLQDRATVLIKNSPKPGIKANDPDHFLFHYLTTQVAILPNPTPTIKAPPDPCAETPACSNAKLVPP